MKVEDSDRMQQVNQKLERIIELLRRELELCPETAHDRWRLRVATEMLVSLQTTLRDAAINYVDRLNRCGDIMRAVFRGWLDAPPEFTSSIQDEELWKHMHELYVHCSDIST